MKNTWTSFQKSLVIFQERKVLPVSKNIIILNFSQKDMNTILYKFVIFFKPRTKNLTFFKPSAPPGYDFTDLNVSDLLCLRQVF